MGRKSQLEKWEARHGKVKLDDDIIREAEAKRAYEETTIEKQGVKVAEKMGMSTEDIFMIIARDSVGTWMNMWNNSMENVIRETIRNDIRPMIQQVLQEELASAARGFMKGLVPQPEQIQEMLKNEPQFQNRLQLLTKQREQELVKFELSPMLANESISNENQQDEENILKHEEFISDEETRLAIIEAHEAGVNVKIAKNFKTFTPRYNTLYQRFGKLNKGANRGAFSRYAEQVIFEHENAEYAIKNENEESVD